MQYPRSIIYNRNDEKKTEQWSVVIQYCLLSLSWQSPLNLNKLTNYAFSLLLIYTAAGFFLSMQLIHFNPLVQLSYKRLRLVDVLNLTCQNINHYHIRNL